MLEEKNFAFAGKTLAEIWSEMVIDGYPTVAEYIDPNLSEIQEEELISKDQNWFDLHLRSSQYLTQIVKCSDKRCCSTFRSSYLNVMPSQFLPPPLPIAQKQVMAFVYLKDQIPKHTNSRRYLLLLV